MSHFLYYLVLLFFLHITYIHCSYRHIALSSPDLCPPNQERIGLTASKTLRLEQGAAAILSLSNVRRHLWKCDLAVKASPGHGLMVRVEDSTLRINADRKGKCMDYVQLGKDDTMPFFTWNKSDKMCGDLSGRSYDVNNGQLLVWVRIGSGRQEVDQIKLSMVVTQYRKKDSQNLTSYRACNSGSQWVSQEYFCDGRVNCAEDIDPADESLQVCRDTGGVTGDQVFPSPSLPSGPPLNLLSITLVLVSLTVLLFLFVLLLVRLKMSNNCCWFSSPLPPDCELPERAVRVGNVSTIPPPLSTVYLEPSASTSLVRGTTPDTEPPPAYQDLFPAGYKFQEKEVIEENSVSLLAETPFRKEDHDVPAIAIEQHSEPAFVSDIL